MNGKLIFRFLGLCVAFSMFAAVLAIPASAAVTETAPYVVKVYNEQNGLPTGEANTIMQTSDGYIWIGSYGGLIRYDGVSFRNYSVEGSITSSSVRALFEDSKGRLWIGTNDSGVVVMANDTFTEIDSGEDNLFLCVRGFAEDADGEIYVASNSGIGKIENNAIVPFVQEDLVGVTVYSAAVDSYGRVWAATGKGDCAIFNDGTLVERFTADRVFSSGDIYCVTADKDGNIILGSGGNEAAVLSLRDEGFEDSSFDITKYSTGSINTHNSVTAYDSGHILISCINGLAVINPDGTVKEFNEDDKATSVNAAVVDYENNIWLASSDVGVIKYSQACFSSPNKAAGLSQVSVNAVTHSGDRYYIACNNGLIICDNDWNRIENELTEMYKEVRIRCVISDAQGNVWIASYSDNAAVCYNPADETITGYNSANGLAGDKARVVYELSGGRVAVGTQTGISIIENGVVTESYGYEDGFVNPSVLCIVEGTDGEILVGSDGDGIYRIKDGKVTNHGFNEGLGEGVVLRMEKNSDADGWFVSAGSSIYYWENGNFKRLTNFTKGAGSVFELYDIGGKLWILQNGGVYAMNKSKLLSGAETEVTHYGLSHGMSGSINANTWHWIDENGDLYISTRNGISVFGFEGVETILPKVIVNSVDIDGKVYEHPIEINIDSGAQRVTIDYSALSFADGGVLRVAYRLNGFDRSETITAERSGSVSYTNLPGGSYTFDIRVFNPENPSECINYSIGVHKDKRITEQVWFWVGLAVLLIAVGYMIVFFRTRMKLKKMNQRHQEYRSIIEQSLMTFAKTIDAKDPYTNGHSIRVAKYSRELARRMGMSEEEQENIYYIAMLHDIGKIGVPDHILNKPGRLTDEEMAVIKRHVDIGGEILKDFTALDGITQGAQFHHERFDGKGYSKGVKGMDIPKVARIISVADTYDAMSSDRCYRKALSTEVLINEFREHSGTQFDPEIVPHMLDMIENGVVPMDID